MKKFLDEYLEKDITLDKKQKLGVFCFIFVLSGIFGWVYEFIFYYYNGGCKIWYMQGGNFLPWINIYAIGAVMIIFLSYRYRKKPLFVFLIAMISTGLLEYFSGYVIYQVTGGLRLWDYNQEILNFGNIGGFVCLRSVLFFGLSALILMYCMLPIFIYLSKSVSVKKFLLIGIILFSIIMLDEIYNLVIARVIHSPRASEVYQELGYQYVKF